MAIHTAAGTRLHLLPRISHVSAREGDHGYGVYMGLGENRFQLVVTLNGRVMKHCVAADARAGYVDYYIQKDGELVINKFKDGAVVYRSHGRVEITC